MEVVNGCVDEFANCRNMSIEDWLKSACADADRRGLPELKPLLENLARSMAALREADRLIDRGHEES